MERKQLSREINDVTTDPVDRLLQERKPASSGFSIAILALLVALAAVSASGWQWWQTTQSGPDAAAREESLKRLQDSQQQLAQSMTALEKQFNAEESRIDPAEFSRRNERLKAVESQMADLHGQSGEDQASIGALQGSVRSLEQRLTATESGVVTIAANSQNSSVALDIAEIDFLLRVASERLNLFSDPLAADLALTAADIQVEALNDPMYLSVRQQIARARQVLAAMPAVDHVQLTARLAEMQSRIPALPFRGEADTGRPPGLPDDAGWWQSFKHGLSSLVTVRRRIPDEQSLLSLEDKDYLRQGLWLQFESARLALMRDDASTWSGSLERVYKTLQQFFQNGSTEVQTLLRDITALKQVNISPEMPDISAPWIQLRQLRDSRRLLQTSSPVAVTPVEVEANDVEANEVDAAEAEAVEPRPIVAEPVKAEAEAVETVPPEAEPEDDGDTGA